MGGWEVSGYGRVTSGRPFTVFSGSNTSSSVVQTPANCTGKCSSGEGTPFLDSASGLIWYFNPTQTAQFSAPGAGAVRQHRAQLLGGAALLRTGCLVPEAHPGQREDQDGTPRRRHQPDQLGSVWRRPRPRSPAPSSGASTTPSTADRGRSRSAQRSTFRVSGKGARRASPLR